jgi:hypothetical protein
MTCEDTTPSGLPLPDYPHPKWHVEITNVLARLDKKFKDTQDTTSGGGGDGTYVVEEETEGTFKNMEAQNIGAHIPADVHRIRTTYWSPHGQLYFSYTGEDTTGLQYAIYDWDTDSVLTGDFDRAVHLDTGAGKGLWWVRDPSDSWGSYVIDANDFTRFSDPSYQPPVSPDDWGIYNSTDGLCYTGTSWIDIANGSTNSGTLSNIGTFGFDSQMFYLDAPGDGSIFIYGRPSTGCHGIHRVVNKSVTHSYALDTRIWNVWYHEGLNKIVVNEEILDMDFTNTAPLPAPLFWDAGTVSLSDDSPPYFGTASYDYTSYGRLGEAVSRWQGETWDDDLEHTVTARFDNWAAGESSRQGINPYVTKDYLVVSRDGRVSIQSSEDGRELDAVVFSSSMNYPKSLKLGADGYLYWFADPATMYRMPLSDLDGVGNDVIASSSKTTGTFENMESFPVWKHASVPARFTNKGAFNTGSSTVWFQTKMRDESFGWEETAFYDPTTDTYDSSWNLSGAAPFTTAAGDSYWLIEDDDGLSDDYWKVLDAETLTQVSGSWQSGTDGMRVNRTPTYYDESTGRLWGETTLGGNVGYMDPLDGSTGPVAVPKSPTYNIGVRGVFPVPGRDEIVFYGDGNGTDPSFIVVDSQTATVKYADSGSGGKNVTSVQYLPHRDEYLYVTGATIDIVSSDLSTRTVTRLLSGEIQGTFTVNGVSVNETNPDQWAILSREIIGFDYLTGYDSSSYGFGYHTYNTEQSRQPADPVGHMGTVNPLVYGDYLIYQGWSRVVISELSSGLCVEHEFGDSLNEWGGFWSDGTYVWWMTGPLTLNRLPLADMVKN